MVDPYETDELLNQYLLFHYGADDNVLPYSDGPRAGLNFPVRVVEECIDFRSLPQSPVALELGCAVGRSCFELSRYCSRVVGVDRSRLFIRAAQQLQKNGRLAFRYQEEGNAYAPAVAMPPGGAIMERIMFEHGDVLELRDDIGKFDVVLLANLIDRLRDPKCCLERLQTLCRPGARVIITSPYTWLEDFTKHENWLGGFGAKGDRIHSIHTIGTILGDAFDLHGVKDMPFLIREHARKFQWCIAQASLWQYHC